MAKLVLSAEEAAKLTTIARRPKSDQRTALRAGIVLVGIARHLCSQMLATNRTLAAKLAALERKITGHDEAIQNLFEAIRTMLADPPGPKRPIGFNRENERP